jgi:hypothetical protein
MTDSKHTVQSLYAAIGDCAEEKLSEEELMSTLEQAGKHLDDREVEVVETLCNSK